MKVLMICNTYFQIFVAIRMKNTIFVNDIVDVVISDRCGYNKEIPSRVKALGCLLYTSCIWMPRSERKNLWHRIKWTTE